jgi:hypothetical protein
LVVGGSLLHADTISSRQVEREARVFMRAS